MSAATMQGYERRSFRAPLGDGTEVEHDVYSRGDGSPVVIIQELPGIGPETLTLADRFVGAGFRVVLPHLFGPLGRVSLLGNTVRVFCLRREFTLFAKGASSPVTDWLAALCRDVAGARAEGGGVGVIGMCLTGNFAISLMAEDAVDAAVASQPSMPFGDQTALHMSEQTVQRARQRLDAAGPMLAYRMEGDRICTAARFEAIDRAFNDDAERIRLRTLPGKGHSVLTLDFIDHEGHPTHSALAEVQDYFRQRLGAPA